MYFFLLLCDFSYVGKVESLTRSDWCVYIWIDVDACLVEMLHTIYTALNEKKATYSHFPQWFFFLLSFGCAFFAMVVSHRAQWLEAIPHQRCDICFTRMKKFFKTSSKYTTPSLTQSLAVVFFLLTLVWMCFFFYQECEFMNIWFFTFGLAMIDVDSKTHMKNTKRRKSE